MALPSGYTEIPYLEATGSQYIDLVLLFNDATTAEIDAEFTSDTGSYALCGVDDALNKFEYSLARPYYTASGTAKVQFSLNTGWDVSSAATGSYESGRHVWKTEFDANDRHVFSIDGVQQGPAMTQNGTVHSSPFRVYLFAVHTIFSSGSEAVYYRAKAKIYEATIRNAAADVTLRHLVPAKRTSDGVLGMYDTVNDRFYTNAGSGSFVTAGIEPPASITVPAEITVGNTVSVAWESSPAAGVTAYLLERSVNGGAFSQIYSGTAYIYADTALSGWETVRYRVRVTDGEIYSSYATSSLRTVIDPSAPTSPNYSEEYKAYLSALLKPYKKIVRLEFLQPDDTVAFALGGAGQKIPIAGRDTRTFLQSGSVSVNLANGQRRRASVMLGNRDGAFDYAVNKLWFGQRVRLSMGMRLPSGEDFWFPMGVFYIENPSNLFSPGEKTATLSLTDKWAYLDGSLFGTLEAAYSVAAGTNIFSAMDSLLRLNRRTYAATSDPSAMIDPSAAVYTSFYNGKTYLASHSDGSISSNIAMTSSPYTITENRGSTMAAVILKLNAMLAGWIGYDAAGALRLEPSQDDIDDADKPVLFAFTPENSVLISMTESAQTSSVYNDVTVAGEGLTNAAVWARAVNADPASDTNINIIGRRVYTEERADYWNTDQCASLARWHLKRKTILQKAVTVECGQMFHLIENRLISVKRVDKPGSPVEKHLIQGFTIPVGETGSMSISCVSVNDIPDFTVTTSVSS